VAGFFIFHWLALKRQRRQELTDSVNRLKDCISNCLEQGEKCWRKSGAEAIQSGEVVLLRAHLTQCSLGLEALTTREKRFAEVKPLMRALRKELDEKNAGSANQTCVDDNTRPVNEGCSLSARASGRALARALDKTLADLHR
jgi:hypothetical protein